MQSALSLIRRQGAHTKYTSQLIRDYRILTLMSRVGRRSTRNDMGACPRAHRNSTTLPKDRFSANLALQLGQRAATLAGAYNVLDVSGHEVVLIIGSSDSSSYPLWCLSSPLPRHHRG